MGLIARFWTLDSGRRGEIVSGFAPFERKHTERQLVFFSKTRVEKVYPWLSYLEANAREEATFPHSGTAFADLDLMLPDGTSPFEAGLPESGALSAHTQSSVSLLDTQAAQAILAKQSKNSLLQADVLRFYESDGRPLADPSDADYVLAAQRQLMVWCEAVKSGRLGLLAVG